MLDKTDLQLSREEFKNLIRHFGRSIWGGTRKLLNTS